jgi:hypothetical protein
MADTSWNFSARTSGRSVSWPEEAQILRGPPAPARGSVRPDGLPGEAHRGSGCTSMGIGLGLAGGPAAARFPLSAGVVEIEASLVIAARGVAGARFSLVFRRRCGLV